MKAKKSYGQHFLNQPQISDQISKSLIHTDAYQDVLEIGPGMGALTQYLLQRPFNLKVVEADKDMVAYLQKNYPALQGEIIPADFLKLRLEDFFADGQFAVIGNFPYNISSQILFKVSKYRHQIPEVVGMFQKEVAERVVAPSGSKTYGVISVLLQIDYEGTYLFTVDKSAFTPPPKVQSAVIRLTRRPKSLVIDEQRGLFKHLVKTAFGQRRKMLRKSLKSMIGDTELKEADWTTERPEQLSVEDFVQLTADFARLSPTAQAFLK